MYVHTYVFVYVCVCMYVYECVRARACVCVKCIHGYIHVYDFDPVYVYACIYKYRVHADIRVATGIGQTRYSPAAPNEGAFETRDRGRVGAKLALAGSGVAALQHVRRAEKLVTSVCKCL